MKKIYTATLKDDWKCDLYNKGKNNAALNVNS